MTRHLVMTAAALLVAYAFLDTPVKPPAAATGPVATVLRSASSTDRNTVSALYSALAEITERDAGQQIPTTGVWRRMHASALRLAAGGTDLPGKYDGLDVAVEEVLADHFDLVDVAITPSLRTKIIAGCREVARQSGG